MNAGIIGRLAAGLATLSVMLVFAEGARRPKLVVTDTHGLVTTLQPTAGLNDGTDDGSATKGKDTDTYMGAPADNRGTLVSCGLYSSTCNEANGAGYIRFSTAGMPTANIASAQIQIKMVVLHWATCGWPYPADPEFGLRRVTSDWNEMTLTWNLQPTFDSTLVSSQTVTGVAGQTPLSVETWLTYDVTELYKSWVSGAVPNYGVRLSHDNPFCMNCEAAYFLTSDDGATKLTYAGPSSSTFGAPVTLSATIEDAAFLVPIAGRPVLFTIGSKTCTGTSDAAGQASCALTPDVAGAQNVAISFAGDTRYYPSTGSGALSVDPVAFSSSLSLTRLSFGAAVGGAAITPAQEVYLGMTGASYNWTGASNAAWLALSPASGKGSGKFSISVVPAALPVAGTYSGRITITLTGSPFAPLVVDCSLVVKAVSTSPFGAFDTPTNNATGIAGNIAVTGWALDDIGVRSVTLWRDPVGPEPTHPNGYVYLADALFVPGARPDVETAYPGNPQAYRAGWGYLMLTNGLPSLTGPKGNGVFKLHAIATDVEGNQVNLGAKTITVDNLNAVKPFGTLDTPAPGEMISGTYLNWGWAMTPQPGFIAVSGTGVWVGVDSVNFAHPVYGIKRADIAAAFPGYANSDTGVGYYLLDTTRFTNGLHNLGWLVYDNLNRGDGIGSRFIQIQNTVVSGDPEPAAQAAAQSTIDAAIQQERAYHLRTARLQRPSPPTAGYPAYRQGFQPNAALTPIRQAGEGLLEPIQLKELDRLELYLPEGQQWTAALRVGSELRDVPVGSTFDPEGGIFYWQLGPVFLGEYRLEFHSANGAVLPVTIRVAARAALAIER